MKQVCKYRYTIPSMNNLHECIKCRAEMKYGKKIQQRRGHRTTQEQYRTYYTWTKIAGWSLPQGPEKISDIPQVARFRKQLIPVKNSWIIFESKEVLSDTIIENAS